MINKLLKITIKNEKIQIQIFGLKFTKNLKNETSKKYIQYLDAIRPTFNCIVSNKKHKHVCEQLNFDFFRLYMLIKYLVFGTIITPHIEFKLLTKCSLNCKDCCHKAPYFKEQMKPITFEKFKEELDILLKKVDYIYSLNFMGGDAMLHNDLDKIISYAMTKKQILNFNFTSNTVIIPTEKFIQAVKNKKHFTLLLSNYSDNEDLKPILHKEEIIDLAKKNHIDYVILPDDKWINPPKLHIDKITNVHSRDCWLSGCKTYAFGKLFFCPIEFYSWFNKLNIEINENECLEVLNDNSITKREIIDFYLQGTSKGYDFCHHCTITPNEYIKKAIQIPRSIIGE